MLSSTSTFLIFYDGQRTPRKIGYCVYNVGPVIRGKRLISVQASAPNVFVSERGMDFAPCIESNVIRFPRLSINLLYARVGLLGKRKKEKIGKEWRNTHVENEIYIYSGVIKAYRSLTERLRRET